MQQVGFTHDLFRQEVLKTHEQYIVDGIISDSDWKACNFKVLFVLKEANNYKGSNIAEVIRKGIAENPKSKIWCRPTFHNVGRWAHGLQNCPDATPNFKDSHQNRKQALLSCAFINLKKTPGGRRATAEVEAFALKYRDFLREQILAIAPDVVVMGGTYSILKECIFPELKKASTRVHLLNELPFINAFHPACTVSRKAMYDQVLINYQQYRLLSEAAVGATTLSSAPLPPTPSQKRPTAVSERQ